MKISNGRFIALVLILMFILGIGFVNMVTAGCYSNYTTPGNILTSSNFNNIANSKDDNTGTTATSNVNGAYVVYDYQGYDSEWSLYGLRIWSDEKSKSGITDATFNINVDGNNEGDISFVNSQWDYYNFSQLYENDDDVNITWVRQVIGSTVDLYEIDFLYIYESSISIQTVYPYHVDNCVITNPTVSVSFNVGYALVCDSWLNATLSSNVSGSWEIFGYYNDTMDSSDNPHTISSVLNGANDLNDVYYWNVSIHVHEGDYDFDVWENRSYYFSVGCVMPVVSGLSNPDCWEMVSIPTIDSYSIYNDDYIYILNTSDSSKKSWNDSVSNGDIYDGLFWWNSSSSQYDNVTVIDPYLGYWMYFYNDSCYLRGNFTNPSPIGSRSGSDYGWICFSLDSNLDHFNLLTFNNGTVVKNWTQAISDGWIVGFVYDWNETEQLYDILGVGGIGNSMNYSQGYWLYAYETLTINNNINDTGNWLYIAGLSLELEVQVLVLLFIMFYMVHKINQKYAGLHTLIGFFAVAMVLWYMTPLNAIDVNLFPIYIVIALIILAFAAYKDWIGYVSS